MTEKITTAEDREALARIATLVYEGHLQWDERDTDLLTAQKRLGTIEAIGEVILDLDETLFDDPAALAWCAARQPAPAAQPEGEGDWWGPDDCFERECEDFGDDPDRPCLTDDQWPCSHVTWVPERVRQWIVEDARQSAPVVSAEQVRDTVAASLARDIADLDNGADGPMGAAALADALIARGWTRG